MRARFRASNIWDDADRSVIAADSLDADLASVCPDTRGNALDELLLWRSPRGISGVCPAPVIQTALHKHADADIWARF